MEPGEKRLHVLMQKVHTIRNDKNKYVHVWFASGGLRHAFNFVRECVRVCESVSACACAVALMCVGCVRKFPLLPSSNLCESGRKRKEAHAHSLEQQAKRLAKKNEALEDYRKSEKKKRYRTEGKEVARRELKKQKSSE